MERYIQSIKKIAAILLVFFSLHLYAQTPSIVKNIRIPLWAELDAYPEMELESSPDEGRYEYPQKKISEVAPFLINGMVYGWNFVYVPGDNARGVEEELEVVEIMPVELIKGGITYVSPWLENNRLNYWCEYHRTPSQIQNYDLWSSINNPKIHGRGYGQIADGFDGIKNAATDALKDAIRAYYRNLIKNKPKEITGAVLIRDLPSLGIVSGRYVINLDFFLECGKIVEYTVY